MAHQENIGDDFLEEILAMPPYVTPDVGGGASVAVQGEVGLSAFSLQLSSGDGPTGAAYSSSFFPLGLSLEQGRGGGSGFSLSNEVPGGGKRFRDEPDAKPPAGPGSWQEREQVQFGSLFPAFGHAQHHQIRPNPPSQVFHGQVTQAGGVSQSLQPPPPRPRVRARRGQATDPHSIAERLRRERIAERLKALQELLPNSNKTDKAAMLDEILDYVKFLRLQVKVLSMSRLGGAGAVAQLVADIPISSIEDDSAEGVRGNKQHLWEKWSTDGTERHVAELLEEDIGAAMQFLQSKALCIMPISLAAAIYHSQPQPDSPTVVKPEPNSS